MKHALTLSILALSGPASAQVPVYSWNSPASAGDQLGQSVADAGDVDGDGLRDVIVGAPFDDPNGPSSGSAYVYSGLDGSLIHHLMGFAQTAGAQFGFAVAGIGDINADGHSDVIVGSPYYDDPYTLKADVGRIYVFSGIDGSVLQSVVGADGELSGYAVSGPGDLDGDGVPDYVWGLPGYAQDRGGVRARSGATHTPLYFPIGLAGGDRVGSALAGLGDVDGDGRADFVAGAPGGDPSALIDAGYALVISGTTGSTIFSISGSYAGGELGTAVSSSGDLDGDGFSDVLVGAPRAQAGGSDSGRAMVVSSQAPYLVLKTIDGQLGNLLGAAVAGGGDFSSDGVPDIIIGLPGFGAGAGRVTVISGNSTQVFFSQGGDPGDRYGCSVAAIDVRNVGILDAIAGAPENDNTAANAGCARLILGQTSGPGAYCTGKANSQGCTPIISYSGTPSATIADDFHVRASGVLNQKAGMLILSWGPDAAPLWGGTLCLSQPIKRTVLQWSGGSSTGNDCTGFLDFHFSHTYMQSQGFVAGQVLYSQYWSRDPGYAAPSDVSLSNALVFTIAP